MSQSPIPKQPFQKPWLPWADQVAKLQSRGLIVDDPAQAENFLSHINYYRFSGYCLAFETDRHQFQPETSIDYIRKAYEFDCALRKLVSEALEVIEIHLRTTVAYRFAERNGPMGHTNQAIFHTPKPSSHPSPKGQFIHKDWISNTRSECKRSKDETFVKHFMDTYAEYPDLPIWVTTEIMSFGNLSKMYKGMLKSDRKPIASDYGLQPNDLESWIHHLVYIRNICAHHSRLWDKKWHILPNRLHGKAWAAPGIPTNSRLFISLLIMYQMMKKCGWEESPESSWRDSVHAHLKTPPQTPNAFHLMGLPTGWDSHSLWS